MNVLVPAIRRIAAAAAMVCLSTAGLGVCFGAETMPDEGICTMHESTVAGPTHHAARSESHGCCSFSAQDDAAPAASVFVPVGSLEPTPSAVTHAATQASVAPDVWRSRVPLPGSQVPKHLFLSVFLI